MNKGRQTAVLRHWFGIDSILFGKPATQVLEGKDLDKFLSTKGAFLSNLYEMYKRINYSPKLKYKTVAEMVQFEQKLVEKSKKVAMTKLNETSILSIVKEEVKQLGDIEGLSEQQVARYVVSKRRNAIALDALTSMGVIDRSPLKESLTVDLGNVLVNAHKTLRDIMIDLSLQ